MTVEIRTGFAPGLTAWIVTTHAAYYARAWNFGPEFADILTQGIGAFRERYDPARDRVFHVPADDDFLGSLTIDGSDPALTAGEAHLRWFIVAEAAQGRGIGRALMNAAMAFLNEADYRSCTLTTFAGLDPARRLYERAGFRLTDEARGATWGTPVLEQRFEWVRGRPDRF